MQRLIAARGVSVHLGNTLRYVRYLDDFDGLPFTNVWDDTVHSRFRVREAVRRPDQP